MIDRGKHNVLGVGIDAVDYEAAEARIIEAARARRPLAASALAVHGVMTGVLDPVQRHRLNRLDLVAPDGQPVRWALNLLHRTRCPIGSTGRTSCCGFSAGRPKKVCRSSSTAARRRCWLTCRRT